MRQTFFRYDERNPLNFLIGKMLFHRPVIRTDLSGFVRAEAKIRAIKRYDRCSILANFNKIKQLDERINVIMYKAGRIIR